MMKLSHLLKHWITIPAEYDCDIRGLSINSQHVQAGHLFFALAGSKTDGLKYIDDAVARGAIAIIAQSETEENYIARCTPAHSDVKQAHARDNASLSPVIYLTNVNQLCSAIAGEFFGNPSRKLTVIGVTGTNGKTSCAYFLAAAFKKLGKKSAYIGTLGAGVFGDEIKTTGLTTADPIKVQSLLADLREDGVQLVAMEVSSHALVQHRVAAVQFACVVFTNLTQDHLDYHGTMAEYWQAKKLLFTQFDWHHAIINADDPYGAELLLELSHHEGRGHQKICGYTQQAIPSELAKISMISADNVELLPQEIHAIIHADHQIGLLKSHLIGRFNLSNLLALMGTMSSLGINLSQILHCIETLPAVPGRMQVFRAAQKPTVVVDYAHTPDALANVLQTLRENCSGQLWCVFGCGGDRDKTKRPIMGKIAATLADQLIITDDNPRSEKPADIVQDILQGIPAAEKAHIEHDRAHAIAYAITHASSEDIVVIAGKGHEDYQEAQGKRVHFSDAEEVSHIL